MKAYYRGGIVIQSVPFFDSTPQIETYPVKNVKSITINPKNIEVMK